MNDFRLGWGGLIIEYYYALAPTLEGLTKGPPSVLLGTRDGITIELRGAGLIEAGGFVKLKSTLSIIGGVISTYHYIALPLTLS